MCSRKWRSETCTLQTLYLSAGKYIEKARDYRIVKWHWFTSARSYPAGSVILEYNLSQWRLDLVFIWTKQSNCNSWICTRCIVNEKQSVKSHSGATTSKARQNLSNTNLSVEAAPEIFSDLHQHPAQVHIRREPLPWEVPQHSPHGLQFTAIQEFWNCTIWDSVFLILFVSFDLYRCMNQHQ